MEVKYTTDGKKVSVVGKLNNTETIVQEIFVTANGAEIPSGENFVVKSLHDQPVESWKEKQLRELEARYYREKNEWEEKITKQKRILENSVAKAALKADSLLDFVDNSNESQLKTLKLMLSGKINYFFIDDTWNPRISTWDDEMYTSDGYDDGKVRNLKLLVVAGASKGYLNYGVSLYSDGSGSKSRIYPFETREEALAYAQKVFDDICEGYLNDENGTIIYYWLKKPIKGLVVPDKVWEKYKQSLEEEKNKRIKNLEEKIEKIRNEA
jgi:hypothetical protein